MRRKKPDSFQHAKATPLLATCALIVAFPCPLSSQSTPTERDAARDVVRQIDELQVRLAPTTTAHRLVASGGSERDQILRQVEQLWNTELRALSDHIGRNPEVGWKEVKAVDTLTKVLRSKGFTVEIDRYGEYRDGITIGSLEELTFAYANHLGAPRINPEPQRPDGYEETGFVTRDIPGVSVGVFSSPAPGHSYPRFEDSLKPVGHTGFLLDAQIMAAVLYHFLTDEALREAVRLEHRTMAGLFDSYIGALKQAYAEETGAVRGSR